MKERAPDAVAIHTYLSKVRLSGDGGAVERLRGLPKEVIAQSGMAIFEILKGLASKASATP
jgi:hypothetical protein